MKTLNKIIILSSVITLIVFLLNGCSKGSVVEIFNNAHSDIDVIFQAQKVTVKTNSSCQFDYSFVADGFAIQINGKLSAYKIPVMDAQKTFKLIDHKRWLDVLTLQLNSDGLIYVIAPTTKLPTSQYPKQPDNFPLQP